jgi:hypothetical protein
MKLREIVFSATLLLFLILVMVISMKFSFAESHLSISLTSKKAEYIPGEKIMLNGSIKNGTSPVANYTVIIDALDKDKIIYHSITTTDNLGKFSDSSLSVPYEAVIPINAKLVNSEKNASNTVATITVSIAKAKWTLILPIISIVIIVAILLFSFPKYQRIGLLGAIGFTGLGYFFLYIYSPLDTVGNAAIAAALLAPLATYVFDTLSKRRETSSLLESSVGEYRKTHLTEELKSLSNIFEEISLHQSIFMAAIDIPENKLSKTKYDSSLKTGTMANLPALRINQYYYYLDYYNKLLEAKLKRSGELSDDQKYKDFADKFKELKSAYSTLNQILYSNILYSTGEIQSRFLSFPTIEFPSRLSRPLLKLLQQAGVINEKKNIDNNIYLPENTPKLMETIGHTFKQAYDKMEEIIKHLAKFKLS